MDFVHAFKRTPLPNLILLLGVLLVILPHLPRLPPWLILLSLATLGWRLLYDMGKLPLPGRLVRIAIVVLAIFGMFISYRTIVGREAGSALLILMLGLKLLEMHSRRDETVVIFLSFFVIVIGFLFSQSIFIALYMVLAVTVLVTSLIGFQHAQRGSGHRLFKRDVIHASRLLLQAAPIALLLFVLFPRVPGPLWGLPEDTASGKTGLNDEMQPGQISQLVNSNAVAFRVRFENRIPLPAERYWRGPVLWHFDGQKWSANKQKVRLRRRLDYTTTDQPLEYKVTLEPHNRHWLFALGVPAILPQGTRLTRELQIITRKPVTKVYRYRMRSYTRYRVDTDHMLWLYRYLDVPEFTAARTRQLVQQIHNESKDNPAYIRKVLAYFRDQPFYYSRQAPLLFDDPTDEFLFQTRKGFCEHYASAFTVMMRLAGIPARVVTGYQGGEMNPLSDYMIVRQSDAHAWSEVWLEDRGWVRVDPTSVIPPSRIESTADLIQRQPETRQSYILEQNWLQQSLRQAGYVWDAINNRWNQWVIGYNQTKQNALFAAFGIEAITWRGLAIVLLISVSIVVLVLGMVLFNQSRQQTDLASKLYRRFLHKLAKQGWHKLPYETPDQFCQRVTRQSHVLAEPVQTITRNFLRLRYDDLDENEQNELLTAFRRTIYQL